MCVLQIIQGQKESERLFIFFCQALGILDDLKHLNLTCDNACDVFRPPTLHGGGLKVCARTGLLPTNLTLRCSSLEVHLADGQLVNLPVKVLGFHPDPKDHQKCNSASQTFLPGDENILECRPHLHRFCPLPLLLLRRFYFSFKFHPTFPIALGEINVRILVGSNI